MPSYGDPGRNGELPLAASVPGVPTSKVTTSCGGTSDEVRRRRLCDSPRSVGVAIAGREAGVGAPRSLVTDA